jgi:uncharacterized protein YdiU (UPF0061 family)
MFKLMQENHVDFTLFFRKPGRAARDVLAEADRSKPTRRCATSSSTARLRRLGVRYRARLRQETATTRRAALAMHASTRNTSCATIWPRWRSKRRRMAIIEVQQAACRARAPFDEQPGQRILCGPAAGLGKPTSK